MLLGFPGCLRFLGVLVHLKNIPVLFVVAEKSNFFQETNKEIKLCPHNVPGFTMEVQTTVAMGVVEA